MAIGKAWPNINLKTLLINFGNLKIVKDGKLDLSYNATKTAEYTKNENINLEIEIFNGQKIFNVYTMDFKKKYIEIKTGKKINIVAISAKNINKKRKFKINKKIFFKNPLEILKKKKIDILFEVIGLSDGISKNLVEESLKKKIHVITPNKALISKHGDKLSILAEKNKVNLEFEAAVCGGVPIIRSIKEGLIANKINRIYGIFNGTSNYILSSMDSNKTSCNETITKAIKLG